MRTAGPISASFTQRDREILGGCAAFATFLLGVGRFSVFTGIDTHDAPTASEFLAGLAAVVGAAILAVGVAWLVGGAGRRCATAVLATGLLVSAAITLLRTRAWESGWLAVLVLAAGVVLLAVARVGRTGDRVSHDA